jgi:hypothetical protein
MKFILTILFLALLSSTPAAGEKDYAIVILDDCENWEFSKENYFPKEEGSDVAKYFGAAKIFEGNDDVYVWMSHKWKYNLPEREIYKKWQELARKNLTDDCKTN